MGPVSHTPNGTTTVPPPLAARVEMAFSNAFLGICHSLAHKLGAAFHIPHGTANALMLNDVIKFNVEAHDFGKIKNNEPAVYSFEITNISDKPVVVENSWASCGCTTPDKIVDPIMPGATVK